MATLKTSFQNLSPSSSRRNSVRPPSSPGSAANSAPSSPVLTQRQNPEATGSEWEEPHPGEKVPIPRSRSALPVTAPHITYPHDVRVGTAQHFSLEGVSSALASLDLDEGASLQSPTDPVQSNESGRTDGPPPDNLIDDLMRQVSEFAPLLSGESWTDRDLRSALLDCATADANEEWRDEKWSKLRSVLDKVATHNPDVASAVRPFQDLLNSSRPSVYPGSIYYQSRW